MTMGAAVGLNVFDENLFSWNIRFDFSENKPRNSALVRKSDCDKYLK